jgi:hypothetical protein
MSFVLMVTALIGGDSSFVIAYVYLDHKFRSFHSKFRLPEGKVLADRQTDRQTDTPSTVFVMHLLIYLLGR